MMLGTSRRIAIAIFVAGCGTGQTRVDPADLQLRDLLGVAPEVAARWDTGQREAARHVLADGLHAQVAPSDVTGASIADRLVTLDESRAEADEDALGLVVLDGAHAVPTPTDLADTARALQLVLDDGWRAQPVAPERGMAVLQTFGGDAGHASGPLVVVPASRLAAIAGYEHGTLLVNPIVIAALDPVGGVVTEVARAQTSFAPQHPAVSGVETAANSSIGNPYSFYGSIAECAASQRTRCEACLPASNCVPVTNTSDGNAECTTLGANGGRGYFLICINAALAISGVDTCAEKKASGCARDTGAATSLSALEANADFLDDAACSSGLDTCLKDLYGAPSGSYPGPGTDAGTSSEPPRSTNVNCGDACSDNNANCQASPNCNCSGPSCGNSLSCDSTCASSNNSNGCGGSCDSCSSSSSSSGGGGGCSSSSSSGGGGGGGCSSSSSSGGSSCGSCGSSSSSSSGGSSCGSCGSSSSSSSGSSGCGSGGKCSVAHGEPNAAFALILSIMWGVLPVPFAARARRRARKSKEVQP